MLIQSHVLRFPASKSASILYWMLLLVGTAAFSLSATASMATAQEDRSAPLAAVGASPEPAVSSSLALQAFYLTLGFIGQLLFGVRFVLQWIASERSKRVVVPRAFWWFSIAGAIITGIYSISILAYPIILSQGVNCLIYSRSLYLSYNHPMASDAAQENADG